LQKILWILTYKLLFAEKPGIRSFSTAAPGSGNEQLMPISNMKFERSLTQPSMVKL
jgi:hypothetical protein